jgi:hypothetical protein
MASLRRKLPPCTTSQCGLGWTINLGHPYGGWTLLGIVLVPIVAVSAAAAAGEPCRGGLGRGSWRDFKLPAVFSRSDSASAVSSGDFRVSAPPPPRL